MPGGPLKDRQPEPWLASPGNCRHAPPTCRCTCCPALVYSAPCPAYHSHSLPCLMRAPQPPFVKPLVPAPHTFRGLAPFQNRHTMTTARLPRVLRCPPSSAACAARTAARAACLTSISWIRRSAFWWMPPTWRRLQSFSTPAATELHGSGCGGAAAPPAPLSNGQWAPATHSWGPASILCHSTRLVPYPRHSQAGNPHRLSTHHAPEPFRAHHSPS